MDQNSKQIKKIHGPCTLKLGQIRNKHTCTHHTHTHTAGGKEREKEIHKQM